MFINMTFVAELLAYEWILLLSCKGIGTWWYLFIEFFKFINGYIQMVIDYFGKRFLTKPIKNSQFICLLRSYLNNFGIRIFTLSWIKQFKNTSLFWMSNEYYMATGTNRQVVGFKYAGIERGRKPPAKWVWGDSFLVRCQQGREGVESTK